MMKKVIYLTLVLFFTLSCTTSKFSLNSSAIDLQYYAERGFTFTTTTIQSPYDAVAIVEANCCNGTKLPEKKSTLNTRDNIYSEPGTSNYRYCTVDDALYGLYQESKALGANAVIDLKITALADGITASGMAIVIK